MTKDEYEDFALRYKGCVACFPVYRTLSRFEKMWFSAIQKDVAELEKENEELKAFESHCDEIEEDAKVIAKENAELKAKLDEIRNYLTYDIPHELMYEATNKIWRMV